MESFNLKMDQLSVAIRECLMCGDEIEPAINESEYAPESRCVLCERRMVETWHELLEALDYLLKETVDSDLEYGIELTEGEHQARDKALEIIARAIGKAA